MAGFDPVKLEAAVEFARTHETQRPRDFSDQQRIFGRPLGPLPAQRGGTNGLILRGGAIVAEFGDTAAVEPVYSAAKSMLSTLLGVALDRGLVKNIDGRVGDQVKDGGYDSAQNQRHHVAASRHADQRVGRHAVRQAAHLPRRRGVRRGRASAPRAAGAGRLLRVQRRAREPLRPLAAARVEAAAAAGVPRRGDDAHRRQHDLAVDSLPRTRPWTWTAARCRRSAAGRGGAAGCGCTRATPRDSACSSCDAASGAAAACLACVGGRRDHARRAEGRLRLSLVAQHRAEASGRQRRPARLPPWASAATPSGSTPTTTWSSCGAGIRATAPSSSVASSRRSASHGATDKLATAALISGRPA